MISVFLKELKKNGWTQIEIAEKCGVTQAFISDLSRGRANASLETALKLADAFGVSLDRVVGRKSPETPITATEELLLKATAGDDSLARVALRSVEGEKLVSKMSDGGGKRAAA